MPARNSTLNSLSQYKAILAGQMLMVILEKVKTFLAQ